MKKTFLLCTLWVSLAVYSQHMYSWRALPACGNVSQVAVSPTHTYAVGGDALVVVDKASEEVDIYTKLNGLHGSSVAQIAYVDAVHALVVAYADGMIDYITERDIIAQNDLSIKSMSESKQANNMCVAGDKVYMAMPFGIIVLNAQKKEITDTYYIGENGSNVNVQSIVLAQDSIFAAGDNILYTASLKDNLLDYSYWHRQPLSGNERYVGLGVYRDTVYSIIGEHLYRREAQSWTLLAEDHVFSYIMNDGKDLYIADDGLGYYSVKENGLDYFSTPGTVHAVRKDGNTFWFALYDKGLCQYADGSFQAYRPEGPVVNIPYRTKIVNDKLYVVPGARWATEENRPANIMVYDIREDIWHNMTAHDIAVQCDTAYIADLMNVAVDPNDENHFFVTCYGTGLLEVQDYKIIHWYNMYNSPILSAAPGRYELKYMRTDGAMFDEEGNLWFVNVGVDNALHVIPAGAMTSRDKGINLDEWHSFPLKDKTGQEYVINTPDVLFTDVRNSDWKWLPYVRYTPGLFFIDDKGTPMNGKDDIATFRGSFTDQNGNVVTPEEIHAVAQEKDGKLWISLQTGLITIPAEVDFVHSNACERIIIPRDDGTDLADYLLHTERINAIAIDGANRKWFGTQGSGVYLISEDGIETIEHFTTENSALPSNTILSISIDPKTGLIFIGTSAGLMAYQSDAAEAEKNLLHAYAYPNPVRRDYTGIITISGLMDNTIIHIADPAGNTIYETRSNGGIAVWDGNNAQGQRVASGVYNVLCNEENGKHTVVKILVMH